MFCIFLKKNKFLKQHLSYLQDSTDSKQLNYEFDVKKFSDRNEIVKQFRKMYEKNTEKVFEAMNSDFREGLLGKGNANRFDLFEQDIGNPNSDQYKFINLK